MSEQNQEEFLTPVQAKSLVVFLLNLQLSNDPRLQKIGRASKW